eukprot:TRINITY_DN3140_c0_g2_i1.p1 TRINITY_DN3140_c0_g2~~TRINITY_DN3140_c0_g2_i1.p1  ORF type:complete len:548 (-),score=100.84 TRINITY_DN3140_c0_g2_i1:194-1747(-)
MVYNAALILGSMLYTGSCVRRDAADGEDLSNDQDDAQEQVSEKLETRQHAEGNVGRSQDKTLFWKSGGGGGGGGGDKQFEHNQGQLVNACHIPECGCKPYKAFWCNAKNSEMKTCGETKEFCEGKCKGVWCNKYENPIPAEEPHPQAPKPKPQDNERPPAPPAPRPQPTPPPAPSPPRDLGSLPLATRDGLLDVAGTVKAGIPLKSSTTDFGFGSSTACGCNGKQATLELAKYGWIGAASPDWIAAPFLTTSGQPALGGSTFTGYRGTTYYSNCANGVGGCGKCWELKTTGEPNIYGKKPDKQYSAKIVMLDICEDRNAYGNNYQWCLAAKNVPEGGVDTKSYSGDCANNVCGFKDNIRLGKFKREGNLTKYSINECVENGRWVCTNMAGYPLHFDFAIQQMDDDFIRKLGVWPKSTNPIVSAKPIQCPKVVTDSLQNNCGGNAKKTLKEGLGVCMYYCPAGHDDVHNPDWWGNCTTDKSCAKANSQCGGTGYSGPTCCQWGQKCVKKNEYYSGCQP